MTRKQIDGAREVRLWIGQIIVPAATVAVTVMTIPEVRHSVAEKWNTAKDKVKRKFKK